MIDVDQSVDAIVEQSVSELDALDHRNEETK